ncbi:MAG: hypothetical protein K8F52_19080 [Candidatus Scalindua rubra]|uniref:Uncharacterized protein n=1 Tax=Candidatus Scalindua brodae TaxID=237368 RepID=A0A0B0ECI5_9BACT|nr:MAG: hypothetical protein SCABRO_03341 [Candidatus Scalindua brodae]MBZ0110763.1 hypothetical protein [Candidatus Scalindua rubra]
MSKTRLTLAIICILMVGFTFTARQAYAVPIAGGYDFFNTGNADVVIPGVGTVQMMGLPFPPDNPL